MTAAPPNWYPDPGNDQYERWWDGMQWSSHTRQAGPTQVQLQQPQQVVQQQQQQLSPAPSQADSMNGIAPSGLEQEREKWLTFAKNEFMEMNKAYEDERLGFEHQLQEVKSLLVDTTEKLYLQEMGLDYDADHPTATSVEFKESVEAARKRRQEMGRKKTAVLGATDWQVNGSVIEGRKMVEQFSKLMLRSYNSELADLLRTTNATNVEVKVKALTKKRGQIKKLGASMHIEIKGEYHDLAVYEIRVTSKYQAMKMKEKEAERERKAQLREQKKIEQELAREQAKLDKETHLHQQALVALESNPEVPSEEIESLKAKIIEVEEAQADIMKRAANTRAGHVYVISNPGSFGKGVVKIGMTRRLEPMDRVNELGDASVPFRFSVHALIFSDDAVGLESDLHRLFESVRINKINKRREFFRTTPQEVKDALSNLNAHLIEFEDEPTNEEWEASQ